VDDEDREGYLFPDETEGEAREVEELERSRHIDDAGLREGRVQEAVRSEEAVSII
jgi:hypothetical protein